STNFRKFKQEYVNYTFYAQRTFQQVSIHGVEYVAMNGQVSCLWIPLQPLRRRMARGLGIPDAFQDQQGRQQQNTPACQEHIADTADIEDGTAHGRARGNRRID